MDSLELKRALIALATELGFARVGVAKAGQLASEGAQLAAWLQQGRHGSMAYMADTADVRTDPRHAGMLPSARSIIVLVAPYARAKGRVGPAPGRVARYAWGRDYHNVLHKRVRKLTRKLRDADHVARSSVDTLPVLERAWAERSGVGFVGKNCCLIVPGLGSHVFLACIVTDADLPSDDPTQRRCGDCSACLDMCPTKAFAGPRELNARRCISYLTIEHRGPVDEDLRADMGDWIFGCDACQDVCPFNSAQRVDDASTSPFAPNARFDTHDAASLLGMSEAEFSDYAIGSPLKRAGCAQMARNAAIVLGNVGQRVHLPVLEHAASEHDDPMVRAAAAWAARRIPKV